MKILFLFLMTASLSIRSRAADTTPPTLSITHTWMEKEGPVIHFKMFLDPRDETGFGQSPVTAIQFRSKLNSTAALPANTAWNDYPWVRGEPFDIAFNCTSVVFELRAVDAAGNTSPLQRRTFASPFPFSPAPKLDPKLGGILPFAGAGMDCRGLFATTFDTLGYGDDIMQFDRATGQVDIRRQDVGGMFVTETLNLTPGSIHDSAVADFNSDGRPDLAVVVDNTLKVFTNQGVVSGSLQFTENIPPGMLTAGISTVQYCAVGDVTGEGLPDIVISGTGDDGLGGSVAKIAVLLNTNDHALTASNSALPTAGTAAGRIGLGDVTGDGWTDLVMADAANKQLVLFQNKANGSFAGDDDATEALRPQRVATGVVLGGLPAESLAVGDVTGDGRADAVITLHFFGATGSSPSDTRDQQLWQVFDSRGAAPLHANGLYWVGPKGPQAETGTPFKSHVILQDLTGDRFPEMVFTSPFEGGVGGVRAIRLVPHLNAENFMTHFDFTEAALTTSAGSPHRLAAGRYGSNTKPDLLVANGSDPQLQWVFNTYTPLSKPTDVVGGASTDSDASGTLAANGAHSYVEYVGGHIAYSISYVNNTATALTGVIVESSLPAGLSCTSLDPGFAFVGAGSSRAVRWTVDVPANSAGVKRFTVRVYSVKVGTAIAPKIALKQGTKTLVSSKMPVVRIGPVNFTVLPNSLDQPWLFTYKPVSLPENAEVGVQTSPNGVDWTLLSHPMTQSPGTLPEFTLSTTDVPTGSHYFRGFTYSEATGHKYSAVVTNFLPATTDLKISSKSPPRSGQAWTFAASQTSKTANLTVRFQSTLTPFTEGSWTDLPVYSPAVVKTPVWTSKTFNVPSGLRYFRAIAAAPGWVDSISTPIGPIDVGSSELILPPFSFFHIDFVDPARNGNPATFYATTPTVGGSKVRFQSKLASEDDSQWNDLRDGTLTKAGNKWTFKTKYMPEGLRDFRAISSASGYIENTTNVYRFEVLPPPLPQIPTYFGEVISPLNDSVQKSGNIPFSLTLFDFNGVQAVTVEYATPGQVFKPIAGSNMNGAVDGITYSTTLNFPGSGVYFLRAAVVDGFTVSQTTHSDYVKITVGAGGGTQPPAIGTFANTLVQSTLKGRGSVKIKVRIGDDKQVHQAFLTRTTHTGVYLSTVGEMIKAGSANPADYSFTHGSLLDGAYYYRVVARDFDGNESTSATVGPFNLVTPPVPPDPVHVDIAETYRFVGPSVPKGKYNHAAMPYPDPGIIEFSYSGLPAGTTQIYVYRVKDGNGSPTFGSASLAYWWQTNSKSSGSFVIAAPYWEADQTHPFEGEGTYRIVVSQGGVEIAHGSGVNEFTVGHAWNLPSTFKTLDYGLYWFKDGKNALRCRENQNDEYFDPSKPTVIYVHGWQPDEVSVKRREGWMREDAYKAGKTYDMVAIWKQFGYNVGLFNWNQFGNSGGPDGLIYSQTNIYGGTVLAQQDFLPAGHSMIYALHGGLDKQKKTITNHFYEDAGSGHPIVGKNVCDLFFDQLELCMKNYQPDADNGREFRVIGHSLGTQVVGKTMWDVLKAPGRGVPVPDRIALLEVAQVNVGTLIPPPNEDFTINEIQLAFIQELIDNGVAVESYQSTDLQSLLGAALSKVGPLHDLTAYARVRPDHIGPLDVTKSHNDIPRWYMNSFDYNELNAWTYWAPFVKRSYRGNALSASSPLSWLHTLMGSRWWYEQSEGKNTVTVDDDEFQIYDNRNP